MKPVCVRLDEETQEALEVKATEAGYADRSAYLRDLVRRDLGLPVDAAVRAS